MVDDGNNDQLNQLVAGDRGIVFTGILVQAPKIRSLDSRIFPFMTYVSPSELDSPVNYEAALQELEQLVARLESGEMPLEQLLEQYQRGAQLLKFCRDRLEAVEVQIKVFDQGALKPWTPD